MILAVRFGALVAILALIAAIIVFSMNTENPSTNAERIALGAVVVHIDGETARLDGAAPDRDELDALIEALLDNTPIVSIVNEVVIDPSARPIHGAAQALELIASRGAMKS